MQQEDSGRLIILGLTGSVTLTRRVGSAELFNATFHCKCYLKNPLNSPYSVFISDVHTHTRSPSYSTRYQSALVFTALDSNLRCFSTRVLGIDSLILLSSPHKRKWSVRMVWQGTVRRGRGAEQSRGLAARTTSSDRNQQL